MCCVLHHLLSIIKTYNFFPMEHDAHNVTGAMVIAGLLACCKDVRILPERIKWQLNAYTNWNLSLILARYVLDLQEWDGFLCVNSIGIFVGFRTAFAQGLDDNIRKKLTCMGLPLTRLQFKCADILVHTIPAIATTYNIVKRKRNIPFVTVTYAITLSTWFVFRQVGKLDASEMYVPHPWKRGWLGAFVGMALTPSFVNALHGRNTKKLLVCLLGFLLPYLSTKMDLALKNTYDFEFICSRKTQKVADRRVSSEPSLTRGLNHLQKS